ncbi:unnamed protein product [Toxocara canis]|uniref:Uncharacterized protein n=1 Tax=Toxocara canis TaxID=6265 RepID=A0A3P7IER6_TOXCA|nr:unnamed protein product [Toxocara canis]
MPAEEIFYGASLKRYDVSVIDESESVIGRAIRIICTDCHYRSEKMGGCSIIGRSDDEVYTERDDVRELDAGSFLFDLPPGSRLIIRDLVPRAHRRPYQR